MELDNPQYRVIEIEINPSLFLPPFVLNGKAKPVRPL